MLHLKRYLSIVLAGIGLCGAVVGAGCGFHPLYRQSTGQNSVTQLASIYIAPIKNRNGQYVRNQLMDTLTPHGMPQNPDYELVVILSGNEHESGFRRDATARRTIMDLKATLTLKNKSTGAVMWTDQTEATSAYSMGSQSEIAAYPAIVASDAAQNRALDLLVGKIRQSLALYFDRVGSGAR